MRREERQKAHVGICGQARIRRYDHTIRSYDTIIRYDTIRENQKRGVLELCPPARDRRTNAAGVAFRSIRDVRGDASVGPKATAGGVIARREGAFRRVHVFTLAPVRAPQGTNIPRGDLSGTRPVLGAGGGRREIGRVDVRGKSGGCGHRNRTRARVNARARGSLMVAYCVHPCRSRRRVGLDGPAPTDICGCRRNEGKRLSSGSWVCEPHPPRRARRGSRSRRVPSTASLRESRLTSTFARRRAHASHRRVMRAATVKAHAHEHRKPDDWFDVRERRHTEVSFQHRLSTTRRNLARREQTRVYCCMYCMYCIEFYVLRSTF